jgi:hypothetical protein
MLRALRKEGLVDSGKQKVITRGTTHTHQTCTGLEINENQEVDFCFRQGFSKTTLKLENRSQLRCGIHRTYEHSRFVGCHLLLAEEPFDAPFEIGANLRFRNVMVPETATPSCAAKQLSLVPLVSHKPVVQKI